MSIQSELLAIKEANKDNVLIVKEVEDWARRHPNSELHAHLEWDDVKAGYQYRLYQIRKLVQIHLIHVPDRPLVLSLSQDQAKPDGGYRDMDEILSSRDLFQMALDDAWAELERLRKRYEYLEALKPIWKAVDRAKTKHENGGKGKGKSKPKKPGKRGGREDRPTA